MQRPDLQPRSKRRREAELSWSHDLLEKYLTAFSHEAVPRTDESKGLCSKCGLTCSDRVHEQHWIEKRERDGVDWMGPAAMCQYEPEPDSA